MHLVIHLCSREHKSQCSISDDPVIFCNNSEAYNGQKGPILTCTVDYEGLDIEKFQYEFGGQTYSENGEQNADFVEVSREVFHLHTFGLV